MIVLNRKDDSAHVLFCFSYVRTLFPELLLEFNSTDFLLLSLFYFAREIKNIPVNDYHFGIPLQKRNRI